MDRNTFFEQFRYPLTPHEEALLPLLLAQNPDPKEITAFCGSIDIDTEHFSLLTLLQWLCTKDNYASAPQDIRPRLQGIGRYLAVQNAGVALQMLELCTQAQAQDIPVLLSFDAAALLGYFPQLPRLSRDPKLIFPKEALPQVRKLAQAAGFQLQDHLTGTALIKNGRRAFDIGSQFHCFSPDKNSQAAWKRSMPMEREGITLHLPSREDMLLQVLMEAFSRFMTRSTPRGRIGWILDLEELKDTDWNTALTLAQEEQMLPHLLVMQHLLKNLALSLAPELTIPESGNEKRQLALFLRICENNDVIRANGGTPPNFASKLRQSYAKRAFYVNAPSFAKEFPAVLKGYDLPGRLFKKR